MTNQAKQAIATLFNAFPSAEESQNALRGLADIYQLAVEDVSPQLVVKAVKHFIQGKVENVSRTFRPTPAELAAHARHLQKAEDRYKQSSQSIDQTLRIDNKFRHQLSEKERRKQVRDCLGYNPERRLTAKPEMLAADRMGNSTLKTWDKDPRRWRDTDELKASLERIKHRGLAEDETESGNLHGLGQDDQISEAAE
jgi:hypothetical protein